MSWIRLDDNFPDHPKTIGLSDKAFRLYISGLCYSSQYLTDGYLSAPVVRRLDGFEGVQELLSAGLWSQTPDGFLIASYTEYQSTKEEVEKAKKANADRVARYREKQKANGSNNAAANGANNDEIMSPHIHTHIPIHTPVPIHNKDIEAKTSSPEIALPRVRSAKEAVERISKKLSDARAEGINAWNLSRLVEDEWDFLHAADDIGGCIGLTVWYISELLSRPLTSSEISRMGQMTKRFGRISLLAIDEAASKDLDDLVSYAYRVAQNMYTEKKAQ